MNYLDKNGLSYLWSKIRSYISSATVARASTADKLTTATTINGVKFDGSTPITISSAPKYDYLTTPQLSNINWWNNPTFKKTGSKDSDWTPDLLPEISAALGNPVKAAGLRWVDDGWGFGTVVPVPANSTVYVASRPAFIGNTANNIFNTRWSFADSGSNISARFYTGGHSVGYSNNAVLCDSTITLPYSATGNAYAFSPDSDGGTPGFPTIVYVRQAVIVLTNNTPTAANAHLCLPCFINAMQATHQQISCFSDFGLTDALGNS